MFTYPFELNLTREDARWGCPSGQDAEEGVRYLMSLPRIERQLKKLGKTKKSRENVRGELQSSGGWEASELKSWDKCLLLVMWISCCNLSEEMHERGKARYGRAGKTCSCRR